MKFKLVQERSRTAFPAKYFKDPIFDIRVFNMADHIMKNYKGGYWDYLESEDNSFGFMAVKKDEIILINPFSKEEIEVPGILAGMIVTSYAMMERCQKGFDLLSQHEKLYDAIYEYCRGIERDDIWMTMMD
jgi:hypothetical protein